MEWKDNFHSSQVKKTRLDNKEKDKKQYLQ